MVTAAAQLLKMLGSAIPKVTGATPSAAPVDKSVSKQAFEDLLNKARSGELSSSRLVEVDESAGVELTAEQIAVLSAAADRAEAEGLRQALVILDDVQLVLDVGARRITGRASLDASNGQPAILQGVDGVINLSTKLRAEPAPARVGPPGGGLGDPTLSKLLERVGLAGDR